MKSYRLFVYASLMSGECDAHLLSGAERIGPARTTPAYTLVDLGVRGALVVGGSVSVIGELYVVDLATLTRIDIERQVPLTYQRAAVQLADDGQAQAYLMSTDQVRGRRRLHHGDWRKRFIPNSSQRPPSAWSQWARGRTKP